MHILTDDERLDATRVIEMAAAGSVSLDKLARLIDPIPPLAWRLRRIASRAVRREVGRTLDAVVLLGTLSVERETRLLLLLSESARQAEAAAPVSPGRAPLRAAS